MSDLPASVRRAAYKVYSCPTLTITTTNPFLVYPPHGTLTTLTIDASVLINDIRHPDRVRPLSTAVDLITTLSITSFSEAIHMLIDEVILQLFDFLKGLLYLQHLKVEEFVLPDASHLPQPFAHTPLAVPDLTVTNTHGTSLDFLVRSIQPQALTLVSCLDIRSLPNCTSLTIVAPDACPELDNILSAWKGRHLTVRAT